MSKHRITSERRTVLTALDNESAIQSARSALGTVYGLLKFSLLSLLAGKAQKFKLKTWTPLSKHIGTIRSLLLLCRVVMMNVVWAGADARAFDAAATATAAAAVSLRHTQTLTCNLLVTQDICGLAQANLSDVGNRQFGLVGFFRRWHPSYALQVLVQREIASVLSRARSHFQ